MSKPLKTVDWWWSEEFDKWVGDQLIKISVLDQSSLVKHCLFLGLPIVTDCPAFMDAKCDFLNGAKEVKESVRLPEEIHDLLREAIKVTKASSSDLIRVCVRMITPLLVKQPSVDLLGRLRFFGPNDPSDE